MQFKAHLIDGAIKSAYGLTIADINGDGQKDIVVGCIGEPVIAWYESPHWEKHLITDRHSGNITLVAHDLTGNGIPDLIVGSGFNRGLRADKGYLQWLESPQESGLPWKSHLIDEIPFIHRVGLADVYGNGKPILIVASIRGRDGERGEWHDPGSLWCYDLPDHPINGTWKRHLIDDGLRINHGLSIGDVDGDGRDDILISSREGLIWYEPPFDSTAGEWGRWVISEEETSDAFAVDLDGDGVNEILSIEPWHGNNLVWHKASGDLRKGDWTRHLIDDTLNRGHSLHALDIDGDGVIEVISGYNGEGTSLQLYRPENLNQNRWTKEIIDQGGIGVGQMHVLDLNSTGNPDIVASGLSTNNLKWYENLG